MSDVINYSYEELSTLFKTQKYIAVDTETTGLNWWRTEVCVVSFAWAGGSTALWVPIEERRPNSPMARLLTELFNYPTNRVIFWNAKFDFHQIRNTFGVESSSWDSFHDAMIMCHLLDENRRMALKVRVKEDLGIDPIEEKQLKLHMRRNKLTTYDEIPLDILLPYAVRDAEFTLMFYAKYFSDVREYFLEVYDLERKVLMVLMEMERHGVLIDKPYLEGVQEQLLTDLDELDISIKNLIGDELNINSPKQLADFFFRKEGLAPVKMGKNHESVDVSVLEKLNHPLAKQLVSYRKKFKLCNTYVIPILEMLDSNGRLHCSYNQVGAKTGRMSCSDPNLQNIPSDRETLLIRRAFVSDSGMVFFDYSGMEARVFAHYCNDTNLINTYNDNLDPYIMVGASIFEIPYEEVVAKLEAGDSEAKNMRYIGKTTFLSTIYGVGKGKLSRELSVSIDEAQSFLKSFFHLYPKIKPFIRTTNDQAQVNGYIATLAGRYRRLEFKENYKAVNSLIQGTATGDMLKASLIKSHEALRETGGALSLVIHDEVAIEGLPHEAIPVIKSILEDFDFKVPIPVDVSVSDYSWADKKELGDMGYYLDKLREMKLKKSLTAEDKKEVVDENYYIDKLPEEMKQERISKIRDNQIVDVRKNDGQQITAEQLGRSRQKTVGDHHSPRFFADPNTEDIRGALGELLFARTYNFPIDLQTRRVDGKVVGDRGLDFPTPVGIINVKTFNKPYNLLVKKKEINNPVDIYVLVRDNGDGTASFVGWEYTSVMKDCPFGDIGGYGLVSYYKAAEKLHPMKEFDALLANTGHKF